ncbi:unnamed protein product [Gongylonema pulchrum]|uniref:Aspartyl-phosphate phosphatase Spo0E family protein n=1 Tax=Gongylonema pulchrum TaxID=637853 RepID=A0A183DA44_9BILA|nr:unnamed protein product [Gongylonema pulchrum]
MCRESLNIRRFCGNGHRLTVREQIRMLVEDLGYRYCKMSQAQLQMVADLEMEMMSDMYRRMSAACQQKCISTRYK